MTIKSKFYNLKFTKTDKDIDKKIFDTINNLPALNVLKDSKLLDRTIKQVNTFIKNKTNFLVFGTGGSNLGAKALVNMCLGREKFNINFFDNIDPLNFRYSIEKINLDMSGFIFISKSGSTPETLSQFGSIYEVFKQKNKLNFFFKNTLIISEDPKSPLFKIAHDNKCKILKHKKDIGGRYSIFSNVGMVPAIIAGLDVKLIHSGALEEINDMSQKESINVANFFYNQNLINNLNNHVIMTYADALYFFGKWYLQLWSESLGKNQKGITPIHAVGTTDQHSQLQLFLDGPRDKFFTFVTSSHTNKGFKINTKIMKNYNLKYLMNKKMGDLMQAEQQATMDTFIQNNFSFREINLKKINEFNIGKLFAKSIMEVVATCIYFNVNPFNQPAVELGKKLTKKYLL